MPADENKAFDIALIDALVDEERFCEIKARYAKELITGFARIDGRVDRDRRQSAEAQGGVLFVDCADKAARFIGICDAFNIPLLFLADVPGFMIGTKVERQGIIRAGAKMIAAVSEPPCRRSQCRGAQGVRRGPVRHVRARPSIPTHAWRCPRRRSP